MKIAIHTITNGTNYGNKLQNYALQTILEKQGAEVETLLNRCSAFDFKLTLKQILKRKIDKYKSDKKNKKYQFQIQGREKKFEDFKNKYLKFSDIIINNNYNDPAINERYDFFICGSDQIWNPDFLSNANANFLSFANYEKRIAYAPSIAVNEIPESRVKEYTNYFNMIPIISVRENQGAKIIKKLTGRDAQVLLDPTMLLTKEEWAQIEQRPELDIEKPYMLTCFLGKVSEERRKLFDDISKKYDLQIIHLTQLEYEKEYMLNPSHFLYLVHNAKLVLTDSFHACVFSILYNTPFYVLERDDVWLSMNSRMDTLLNTFNLQDRRKENIEDIVLECDYSNIDKVLNQERKKSIAFLRKALKLEE